MTGPSSRRLRAASPFDRLDRLKTGLRARLDKASRTDQVTGLPKNAMREALDAASTVDPATGRPETP